MRVFACSVFIFVMSLLISGFALAEQGGKWHGSGVYMETTTLEGVFENSPFKEHRFEVDVEVGLDFSDSGIFVTVYYGSPCAVQLYGNSVTGNNDILDSYDVSKDPVKGVCGGLSGGHVSLEKHGDFIAFNLMNGKARLDAFLNKVY